jgi:hypothetical protein
MREVKNLTKIYKSPAMGYEEDDNSEKRLNFVMGFIGHNRTGKTATAKQIAMHWKQSRPNGRILAFDPQYQFRTIADEIIYGTEVHTWHKKALSYRDSLIIFDDYKALMPGRNAPDGLLELLTMRSHYNIDIIYITHSPSLVLNTLTYYTTHYMIFYTQTSMGGFEKKIPNYLYVQTAINEVNKYVGKYGRGKYPLFPYITFDVQAEKMSAVNMNNAKDDIE